MKKTRAAIPIVLLALAYLLGHGLFLWHWGLHLDSDESVTGIMARHILAQGEMPIFFYGQAYMGTLEPAVVAMFFAWLGMSPVVLKLVPFLFSVGTIGVYLRIRQTCEEESLVPALLPFVFPPLFYTIWSMKARGGFIEVVFLSLLVFWSLLAYERSGKRLYVYVQALVAGFAVYVNVLCLPFLVVLYGVSLLKHGWRPADGRGSASAGASWGSCIRTGLFFVIGYSPAIVYTILTHRPQNVAPGQWFSGNGGDKLHVLFTQVIPLSLGSDLQNFSLNVFSSFELLLFVTNVCLLVLCVFHYRWSFVSLVRLRREEYPLGFVFLLAFLMYGLALLPGAPVIDADGVRYLVFGIVCLPAVQTTAYHVVRSRSGFLAYALLVVLLISGGVVNSQIVFNRDKAVPTSLYALASRSRAYDGLIQYLVRNRMNSGYASYWTQWNIDFLSQERLKFASYQQNRYLPYVTLAQSQSKPVYIYDDTGIDTNKVLAALNRGRDDSYRADTIDGFVVCR